MGLLCPTVVNANVVHFAAVKSPSVPPNYKQHYLAFLVEFQQFGLQQSLLFIPVLLIVFLTF